MELLSCFKKMYYTLPLYIYVFVSSSLLGSFILPSGSGTLQVRQKRQ